MRKQSPEFSEEVIARKTYCAKNIKFLLQRKLCCAIINFAEVANGKLMR